MNIKAGSPHWLIVAVALLLLGPATALAGDLPGRVGRLSLVQGQVSIGPAGSNDWLSARRNRPVLGGDRLFTGQSSRAVLELGAAALRLDDNTAATLMALQPDRVQVRVSQGTVNLAVYHMDSNQIYEIDTPALAFVVDRAGSYRIDIDPNGRGAMVTVVSGHGTVWDASNAERAVSPGRSYRFDTGYVSQAAMQSIPRNNSFDRFCAQLDRRYRSSRSSRYVAPNVVGYSDLDRYGYWQTSTTYGNIWFPSNVPAGWAPYRDGRWSWIEPWGWTWVDQAPWGFAPFHYGRWARVNQRWGWVPGPQLRRAVFAPALVAFLGNVTLSVGSSAPVAWFPLGPRDVYWPGYQVTENYFININLGSGRFFQRRSMRNYWTDYHRNGRRRHDRYAYRDDHQAVTAASLDQFRDSRLIQRSQARVSRAGLRQASIQHTPDIKPAPVKQRANHTGLRPQKAVLQRAVVTRHTLESRQAPRGQPRARASITNPAQSNAAGQQRAALASRAAGATPRNTPASQPTRSTERPRAQPQRAATTPSAPARSPARQEAGATERGLPRALPRGAPRSKPTAAPDRPAQRATSPAPRTSARPRATPQRTSPARQIESRPPATPRAVSRPRSTPSQSAASIQRTRPAAPKRQTSPRAAPRRSAISSRPSRATASPPSRSASKRSTPKRASSTTPRSSKSSSSSRRGDPRGRPTRSALQNNR